MAIEAQTKYNLSSFSKAERENRIHLCENLKKISTVAALIFAGVAVFFYPSLSYPSLFCLLACAYLSVEAARVANNIIKILNPENELQIVFYEPVRQQFESPGITKKDFIDFITKDSPLIRLLFV